MKWDYLFSAAAKAYGGKSTVAGKAAVDLLRLVQLRGMPFPLVHPEHVAVGEKSATDSTIGLMASRPISQGEVVVEIPPAVWFPHSASAALEAARKNVPAFVDAMVLLDAAIATKKGQERKASVAPLAALAMQVLFRATPGPDAAYLEWLHHAVPPAAIVDSMPAFWGRERLMHLQGAAGLSDQGSTDSSGDENGTRGGEIGGGGGGSIGRLPALAKAIHSSLFGGSESSAAGGGAPPVSLLLYALCLVQSRATNSSPASFPFSMVPYFDLLNHSAAPNCGHRFDDSRQSYVVTATSDIASGEECTISYGHLSNGSLLRLYGFTLEPPLLLEKPFSRQGAEREPALAAASLLCGPAPLNLLDIDGLLLKGRQLSLVAEQDHTAAAAGAPAEHIQRMYDTAALLRPEDLLLPSLHAPLPSQNLQQFALAAAIAGVLPPLTAATTTTNVDKDTPPLHPSVGEFNMPSKESASGTGDEDKSALLEHAKKEEAAKDWLVSRVDAQLESYGTTLQSDEAALGTGDDGTMPSWLRHCLVVRIGEKRVLQVARTALLELRAAEHASRKKNCTRL